MSNTEIDALGAREWVTLTVASTGRYVVSGEGGTTKTYQADYDAPMGRSYSSMHSMGAGKCFYFGGGHTSYPGNDVEILTIANGSGVAQWDQTTYNGTNYTIESPKAGNDYYNFGTCTTAGTYGPYGTHTYQACVWDAANSRILHVSKTSGTWAFSPATNQWTQLLTGAETYYGGGRDPADTPILLASDPNIGAITCPVPDGWDSFQLYKFAGGAWSLVSGAGASFRLIGGTCKACYVSSIGAHLVRGLVPGGGSAVLYRFKYTDTTKWRELTDLPAGVLNATHFDYDSVNDRVVFFDGVTSPGDMWAWNPASEPQGTWESYTGASHPAGHPTDLAAADQTGHLMPYDATNNCFIFYGPAIGGGFSGGAPASTYAFRYAGSTPAGSTPTLALFLR